MRESAIYFESLRLCYAIFVIQALKIRAHTYFITIRHSLLHALFVVYAAGHSLSSLSLYVYHCSIAAVNAILRHF